MSQNLADNDPLTSSGQGVNVGIDLGLGGGKKPDKPCIPSTPTTLKEVIKSLVNEQIQVTTPFGEVTGTLIAVKDDYIVIIDMMRDQTLVRIDKIELINEDLKDGY